MSTLQNEILIESIYEDVISEATDTDHLAMMTNEDIEAEVRRRFAARS